MNLAGVIMAAGVGGLLLTGVNGYLINLKAQQSNLSLRTELQEELKNFRMRTDCSRTLASVNFSTVPASGQPIVLKSAPSSAVVLPLNGSQRGKFSYIADVFPDRSIRLQAALLLNSQSNPRAALTASSAKYGQDPVLRQDWTWSYTTNHLSSTTPSLATLCQGGGSLLANIQCGKNHVLNGFDANGAPICVNLLAPEYKAPTPKILCTSGPLGNVSYCPAGYLATGCWQRTNTTLFQRNLKDFDINWTGTGCTTDGEEAAAGIEIAAICCKIMP